MNKDELLNRLKFETRVLNTSKLETAFKLIDRKDFIYKDHESEAYEDYALPLISGSTISQPTTVAFMLELLELETGNLVLDIGSGSGWTTALMSKIVGKNGWVVGVEIIPELIRFSKDNLKKYKIKNVSIELATERLGFPEIGPYDRILVGASAREVPEELFQQLKSGGILVIPIKESIFKIKKTKSGEIEKTEFSGFSFVPLKY